MLPGEAKASLEILLVSLALHIRIKNQESYFPNSSTSCMITKTFALWTANKAGTTLFPYLYQLDFLRNHSEPEVLETQLLESLANADWYEDDSMLDSMHEEVTVKVVSLKLTHSRNPKK